MSTSDPSRSVGDTSVVGVLARFASQGWSANHVALDGGRLRCGVCGSVVAAAEMRVEARHRVEGASDPSEMQVVYGLACPVCSARGALVASYGPAGSKQSDDIVANLPSGDPIDPIAAGVTEPGV
jgi:hypothetical protein